MVSSNRGEGIGEGDGISSGLWARGRDVARRGWVEVPDHQHLVFRDGGDIASAVRSLATTKRHAIDSIMMATKTTAKGEDGLFTVSSLVQEVEPSIVAGYYEPVQQ